MRYVALFVVTAIGCTGSGQQPRASNPEIKINAELDRPDRIDVANKTPFERDGLRIMLERAGIRKVSLDNGNDSDEPYLLLTVRVTNFTQASLIDFEPWGRAGSATLFDDVGNIYKPGRFGFGVTVAGQPGRSTIRPRDSIVDLLIFERPVSAANKLLIDLPLDKGEPARFKFLPPA